MVFPILIIESHLGSTDCSGCRFFCRGRNIFAQPLRPEDALCRMKFASLPLKVAELPTLEAAVEALARIDEARRHKKGCVYLKDLET